MKKSSIPVWPANFVRPPPRACRAGELKRIELLRSFLGIWTSATSDADPGSRQTLPSPVLNASRNTSPNCRNMALRLDDSRHASAMMRGGLRLPAASRRGSDRAECRPGSPFPARGSRPARWRPSAPAYAGWCPESRCCAARLPANRRRARVRAGNGHPPAAADRRRHILRADFLAPGQPVIGREDHVKTVAGELHRLQTVGGIGQRDDRGVGLPAFEPGQHGRRLLLAQIDFQLGKGVVQHRHDARDEKRPDGRDDAELQRAGQGIARVMGRLDQFLGLAQEVFGALSEVEPDRGGNDHALGALQQLDPEQDFKLLYGGAERGLADEAFLRGRAEMAALDHGDQETQLAKCRKQVSWTRD